MVDSEGRPMSRPFQPGDLVIWWKRVSGEFVSPVLATVLAVTAKRVKITAEDPDEDGSGLVVRYDAPASLQLKEQPGSASPRKQAKADPRLSPGGRGHGGNDS
jgi:hypothetical protein